MHGSYDYRLVVLSVLIAICAAYAALDLAARTTARKAESGWHGLQAAQRPWAWASGPCTTSGCWRLACRFLCSMTGHRPAVSTGCHFASAVALFVVSRKQMGWISALAGSAIMGGGIATMHYTGMAAMRLRAMCSYDPLLLTLSVVSAMAISLIALWLTFRFREDAKTPLWWKTGSAVVMGAAIP